MECENGNFKVLTGLLIGIAAGAAAGILMAPQSGKATRKKLRKCSDDFNKKACKIKNDFCGKLDEFKSRLQTDVGEVVEGAMNIKDEFKKGAGA